jgi:NAD(P)-dependent dehydrogenase (short-subunit alcohol dehydrogenase family)
MEIRGSRVLLLGGSGLVGMALARQLLPLKPALVVVSGLTQSEAETAVEELRADPEADGVELAAEWGDIFLSHDMKDRRRRELVADADARGRILDDLLGPLSEEVIERSTLGRIIARHRPEAIVDTINTATAFAYQNTFDSAAELREKARAGGADLDAVETHLATMYLPQLIRHVQLALEVMKRAQTSVYVKVGTAGTGGMGLNIPFTHSEERPSRMLLAKSSIAGAHTLLLYLMARTPGAPTVKEIKPTAAISWKKIGFGEVQRGGRPIRRIDATAPVAVRDLVQGAPAEGSWRDTGEPLTGVYVDSGENGLFSPPEFETLTALGLMEFITPEEIAQDVVREIRGSPTGHDVVAALDGATSGPTYRAGVLRQSAIARMEELQAEHEVESVAYEMLGPPRLSKLLFEAAILGRLTGGALEAAAVIDPAAAAERAEALLTGDAELRTAILSIGLPILLPDGERVLRGADVKVGPEPGEPWEKAAENGWVDLRPESWRRWRDRVSAICRRMEGCGDAAMGSRWDVEPWERSRRIRPGALAAWVFRHEDRGERIKR